jgi:hypothetical protein
MPASSRRSRRNARAGTLRLLLVLVGLIGINIYFLGFRGGTSIGALLHSTRLRPGIAEPISPHSAQKPPLPEDPVSGRLMDGQLADGQTIAQALTPRIGPRQAAQLEEVLGGSFDLRTLRAGQGFVLVYDAEERLVAFEFRPNATLAYRLELGGKRPVIRTLPGRAETRTVELSLPTGPAIWEALRRAGESAALGERLCELYAGDGDLCGAAVGERVRVVAEKQLIGGRLLRYGRILGAEWVTRAGVRRAFYFGGMAPGYYTERGQTLMRVARVTPFRASRGLVTGRAAVQRQADRALVEYGAPTGNGLMMACARTAGTVTGITRAPAGATVSLLVGAEHHTYAHLTRLARGLQLGQAIEQGQALGRADGGLLLTVDGESAVREGHALAPRGAGLAAAERPRFGEAIAPVLERLRALALRPGDPLASGGLSAIP